MSEENQPDGRRGKTAGRIASRRTIGRTGTTAFCFQNLVTENEKVNIDCVCVCLSVCLSDFLSVCLSVCPSVSICPSQAIPQKLLKLPSSNLAWPLPQTSACITC